MTPRQPNEVDAYLAALPDDKRTILEDLRQTIRKLAPNAVEAIGYGIPGFKYKGKPLIYIGAAKNHCAIYGGSVDSYRDELSGYKTSKGTIQFTADKPLPPGLVERMVRDRMAEIDDAVAAKRRK